MTFNLVRGALSSHWQICYPGASKRGTGEHHSVVSIAGATASIAGGWTDQDLPELKRLYGHSREFFQRPSRYKEPADMLNASCYF